MHLNPPTRGEIRDVVIFLSLGNSDDWIYHYWPESRSQQTAGLSCSEWKLLYSHLRFFKGIVCHLRWRWKTPSKACQYLVLGLHHNLSCLLPSTPSFSFAIHIFWDTGHMQEGSKLAFMSWEISREPRRWGREMCTWNPPNFGCGEALLWSKDASINLEVYLCTQLHWWILLMDHL